MTLQKIKKEIEQKNDQLFKLKQFSMFITDAIDEGKSIEALRVIVETMGIKKTLHELISEENSQP